MLRRIFDHQKYLCYYELISSQSRCCRLYSLTEIRNEIMDYNTPEVFLEFVVKGLVDNPDDVNIEKRIDEMGVLLTLDVHPDDMGKVIGRKGATAKAVRTLLRVVGMKNNARVNMKIKEPEGSTHPAAQNNESESESESGSEPDSSASDEMDAAMEDLKSDL